MATLLAHITVKPGCEDAFEQIARTLYERTHADETDVRRYEYWRGADPQTYYTLLSFDDHRAFIVHQVSDHHEEASPAIGQVVENIHLEWVDPIVGASPLVPTDMQPAPEGASDLAVTYTDRYAASVADWWLAQR
ncbi:putative quinol monooxygenase [Ilumatobacter nonamiensis]|uniref:putative quinol monooxygenase n=1 Tax=Ilumatobacter nonamiensis TaxID=467093 RepID=UPI00058B22FB|nr:antibiotic biosynthesis monooxygenase [Ilumatobacter nonamiensis]